MSPRKFDATPTESPMGNKTSGGRKEVLTSIARQHLDMPTLETWNSDSLDFHEVSVWQTAKALSAAYDAGAAGLLAAAEALLKARDEGSDPAGAWEDLRRAVTQARN